MERRRLLARFAQAGLISAMEGVFPASLLAAARGRAKDRAVPAKPVAMPSAEQVAWQDLELGMFVHFAPNTWQDVESDNLTTPLSEINPAKLDTDQWARTAVDLGARYIVFVAKHQGGFCMWQTEATDYSLRNTPWRGGRGDVLREISASCRRFGLKLGVYVCPRDDHFGAKTGGVCETPELQARYDAMYRQQLTEVLSRYGDLVEVWFDGSTATPVGDLLKRYQPRAMVFQGPSATIRWVGNEDGFAPYPCWNGIERAEARSGTATSLNSDPDGDAWMPNEVDVSMRRPDWFWSTRNAGKVLTVEQLLSVYYRSVGRGAQLLLNIPANRDGLLPAEDCAVARSFGLELRRRFGRPLATTSGNGSTVTVELGGPVRVDTVVLREEIATGERIRGYTIQGRVKGLWSPLATGTAVGHRRVQPVGPVTVDAVRVRVGRSVGRAAIRELAVFDTGVAPPADWDATSRVWAANLVGRWADHVFSINLSKAIRVARQYRLRFVGSGGEVTGLAELVLTLHGVNEPGLLKRVKGRSDEVILDITGVAETVVVTGRVEGPSAGEVVLEAL